MKKIGLVLVLAMTAVLAGCSSQNSATETSGSDAATAEETGKENASGENAEVYNLSDVKYTTVTEGFDWGPAITKVVLDMGEVMDTSGLTTDTFSVSAVKEYYAANMETMTTDTELTEETAKRVVTAAYASDAEGNKTEDSTYLTLEMQVGANLSEGSPLYYNMLTNHNVYVDTSYVVELVKSNELKTNAGNTVEMTVTDKNGYASNKNLIADVFDLTGTYTKDDITLKYASFTPKAASSEEGSNPLIIWLHGLGEAGENPLIAIYGNKVVNLATEEIQTCFGETGAYVLVPQCTTMWMDYDGTETWNDKVEKSDGKSYYTEALMGLIEEYVESHPEIDTNRIYIGGCSNGGYMTVNMIINYPDYFAAAYPICEAYSAKWLTAEKIEAIKDVPIWFTHAKTDGTVPVYAGEMDYTTMTYNFSLDESGEPVALDDYTNAIYKQLTQAGAADAHYTLWDNVVDTTGKYFKTDSTTEPYEYMGHWSWIYTLNNECKETIDGNELTIFEWLASHSK
ncbi:prolyl oligopeptidase family serine peptidase [Konateibacter massiliensis]|uniref:prolyl oligopeptidase family serine peptidase n=1 Tax=Konateibacter massiliensis TaxID=2002841 RepID=UPI000C14CF9D|nr:prolyl oligopeptidase family serine peptidase [Konateibacter massiliensis]